MTFTSIEIFSPELCNLDDNSIHAMRNAEGIETRAPEKAIQLLLKMMKRNASLNSAEHIL